jgi:transcriptional regulator with XRE-family HTH domain
MSTPYPKLREWREARGLSQRELARRAGIVLQTVVNIEHHRHKPHPGTLEKVAKVVGCRAGDLFSPPPFLFNRHDPTQG